jgi:hypothetical protein
LFFDSQQRHGAPPFKMYLKCILNCAANAGNAAWAENERSVAPRGITSDY